MERINRRDFIAALAAAGLVAPGLAAAASAGRREPAFLQGVASGDPLHDRVILWTRVTPVERPGSVAVQWRIARDPSLRNPVAAGAVVTDAGRDFTVKVDAAGLEPGQTYYYGFRCAGVDSPRGRTRTLPLGGADALRFAVVSCSNFPYGYFNAYRRIAERNDLDFVLHLGDYIYEYALGEYANPLLAGLRDVVPTTEIVTLGDYRLRHALYKTDAGPAGTAPPAPDDRRVGRPRVGQRRVARRRGEPQPRARRRRVERAQGGGTARLRRIHAHPHVQRPAISRIYRQFRFGNLADVIMLDTRLHGRDLQAAFKGGTPRCR